MTYALRRFSGARAGLTRISLLEGRWARKSLEIRFGLAKVCSHFPVLFSP
jgi:hypothetical protein